MLQRRPVTSETKGKICWACVTQKCHDTPIGAMNERSRPLRLVGRRYILLGHTYTREQRGPSTQQRESTDQAPFGRESLWHGQEQCQVRRQVIGPLVDSPSDTIPGYGVRRTILCKTEDRTYSSLFLIQLLPATRTE